ncbi:DMT family transporter [Georgenia yuyongxinii]|uniref:DMT family transporter n=2 Tax=Georgenia yuyongxinii TaxID=2589797 RepID=A0A5B8CE44_9MICO|nr:DMT family transporter [Georgenia yuyongxinii]
MFLSSSLMGGIGAFARYIDAPGDFIAFNRSLAGLIGMTAIFLATKGFLKVRATKFTPSLLLSGVFLGLLSSLYVISTQMTTLANASFLIYTGPIYSTVLSAIFLKEPLKKSMIASLGAVLVGTLLIIGIINYTAGDGFTVGLDLDPQYMTGNLVALVSGVAYGLYLFFSRYRTDCDSNVRAGFNFLFAVVTIGVILMFRTPDLSGMDSRSWIVLAIAAVVTGFGAFYFLTVATRILLAGELAVISYQETIMATVLGLVLFAEPLTGMQALGGVLIVGGGLSQILASTKARPKRADGPDAVGAAPDREPTTPVQSAPEPAPVIASTLTADPAEPTAAPAMASAATAAAPAVAAPTAGTRSSRRTN